MEKGGQTPAMSWGRTARRAGVARAESVRGIVVRVKFIGLVMMVLVPISLSFENGVVFTT